MTGSAKPAAKRAAKPPAKRAAKAAASRRGAAARAEVDGDRKTYTFEGLELTIPAELPSAIMFDVVESEASEGTANEYLVNLRILRSVVGRDQFMTLRHRIGNDTDKVWELMGGLLGQYGLTMGESSASPES